MYLRDRSLGVIQLLNHSLDVSLFGLRGLRGRIWGWEWFGIGRGREFAIGRPWPNHNLMVFLSVRFDRDRRRSECGLFVVHVLIGWRRCLKEKLSARSGG